MDEIKTDQVSPSYAIPGAIIVAGLIIGGVVAAPFAATIISKLPEKFLMIFVGSLIIFLSLINLLK